MASEIRGIVTCLALVALLLLAGASFNVGFPGQEMLGSLRFHIGLTALLLPLVLFATGAWFRGLIFLVAIGASLGQGALIVQAQQQTRSSFDDQTPSAMLDIISFNILGTNPRGDAVRQMLVTEAPDLAVIMESRPIEPYLEALSGTFPWRAGCATGSACDMVILSRVPLSGVEVRPFGFFQNERFIVARGSTESGVQFTIIGLHLTKPYFDDAAVYELRSVLNRVRLLDGPVILAGDLNAAAWSSRIAAFVEAGAFIPPPRYPGTWPVELAGFGVPIDNIFTRGSARVEDIAALPHPLGSNHLGLRASVGIYD